jgi:hypothetical protein
MSLYYSLLFIFSILGYAIVVDKNVSDAIVLLFKLFQIKLERFYWMIRFHPRNPITNLIMKWKYEKLAQDLLEELTAHESHVSMESESKTQ